ncbi:MAG: DUF2232 domain-containing protein [Alphaproteobacteria bacterium]|nr:DUF2232 domain-containing protein [Alphaproteobacteria bacterium]
MRRPAVAAIAALLGGLGACLYMAILLGSPGALVLVYLTQLPLFAAGLWLGTGAAAIAGLTGAVILLAVADLMAAALFVGLNAAPVVLLVREALLARRDAAGAIAWYPAGLLGAWLAALGLAGIGVALLWLGGPGGVDEALWHLLSRLLGPADGQDPAERDALASALVAVLPGMIAASWMAMTAINGCLAQGLLSRFRANWRPSPDIALLKLPLWLPIVLLAAAAASFFDGAVRFLGVNAMVALLVPFGLAGLAVVHMAVRRLSHPAVALTAFYVFAGMFGWPLFVLAVVGVFESWLGLRRRLAPPGRSGGDIDG